MSASEVVDTLTGDLTSGSAELANKAVLLLRDYTLQQSMLSEQPLEAAHQLCEQIAIARPSMVSLSNQVRQWWLAVRHIDTASTNHFCNELNAQTDALIRQWQNDRAAQCRHAANVLAEVTSLITISRSSSVANALKQLQQRPLRVICCESRPGLEGQTLGLELAETGIQADIITDAAMAIYATQAQAVLLGADAVLNDGSVVNKTGSYLLAMVATEHKIPVYVLADTTKVANAGANDFELESQSPAELGAPHHPRLSAHNPYFECVPMRYISAVIDQHGLNHDLCGWHRKHLV